MLVAKFYAMITVLRSNPPHQSNMHKGAFRLSVTLSYQEHDNFCVIKKYRRNDKQHFYLLFNHP